MTTKQELEKALEDTLLNIELIKNKDELSTSEFYFSLYGETITQVLKQALREDVVMCVKKTHLPEHDGATGYFYYEPVEKDGGKND